MDFIRKIDKLELVERAHQERSRQVSGELIFFGASCGALGSVLDSITDPISRGDYVSAGGQAIFGVLIGSIVYAEGRILSRNYIRRSD